MVLAAREHTVEGVSGMVPQRETDHAAGAVVAAKRVIVERLVFLGRAAKQVNLAGVEHAAGQHVALAVKLGGENV
jgi:hypothetical protein